MLGAPMTAPLDGQDPARIRVCFLGKAATVGGMERTLGSIVEYLDPAQFESMILLRDGGPTLEQYRKFAPTHLFSPTPAPRGSRLRRSAPVSVPDAQAQWARDLVTEFDPHVLVFHHNVEIPRYTGLADLGVPTIQMIAQHWSAMVGYNDAWLQTLASRTHYICEGRTSVNNARFLLGVPEDRISVFSVGPDAADRDLELARPDRPRRADVGLPDDALVVCAVANLGISKGPDLFLRAAAELRTRRPDLPLRFLWVGGSDAQWEGSRGQTLRRVVDDLDLGDVVTMLPQVPKAYPYYAMADIYVQPSRDDAFPGATLEAMSVGTPVVSFGIGIAAEDAAVDALVRVDVIDPVALADGIERLADDAALRDRLGSAGRRLVTEEYAVEAAVERYADMLRSVVARGLG
jgi:glycosyltransferase involved in cell wall biosynthesis